MDSFLSGLPGFIWSVAGALVIFLSGAAYRKLRSWKSERDEIIEMKESLKRDHVQFLKLLEIQEVQNAALREILGELLGNEHERLVQQGHATPTEKECYEKRYNIYHSLGGNGTRTALYEDVMKMNSYPIS